MLTINLKQDFRTTNDNHMLKSALEYAAMGWHVFPCGANKKPLIKGWPQKATINPDKIRQWWNQWPDANIGVLTGAKSGLIAIDLDTDKTTGETIGETTMAVLEFRHEWLSSTVTAKTPSGGKHNLFKYPGWKCPNTAKKIGDGIDSRGDGGYILVAPSRTADGAYIWEAGKAPGEIELADLPAWLGNMLQPKEQPEEGNLGPLLMPEEGSTPALALPRKSRGVSAYAEAAINNELGQLQKASKGNRNDTLNRSAFSLGQLVGVGLLGRQQVEHRLFMTAVNILELPKSEAQATIRSGVEAGIKQPRRLPASILVDFLRQNEKADADLFLSFMKGRLVYDHTAKRWYRWAGHYWIEDKVNEALSFVDYVMKYYEDTATKLKADIKELEGKGNTEK